MSLEEFAQIYHLDSRWIEARHACNRIVARADFWYRKELKSAAQEIAVRASDILVATANERASTFPAVRDRCR